MEIDKLREERVERTAATPEYFQQAMQAYSDMPNVQALIITMAFTGRRLGEVIAWRRDVVDWKLGQVSTGRTKNGDPITVHLPQQILDRLWALPLYENGRVFGYTTNTSMQPAMRRRCKKAGIPYLGPHQIGRHTFATWAVRYGRMSIKQVMAAGGWKSLGAVERYLHVTPSEAQVEAARLFDEVPGLAAAVRRAIREPDKDSFG